MENQVSKPLVIYHAACADGFCAAWVAKKALIDPEFVPANYGDEPPPVNHRTVYILDFSYNRPVLMRMAEVAESITVMDHHKTAQADLSAQVAENVTVTFDMEKSGGRLAWDHFFPGKQIPWLVDYTEDRDLWRWKLKDSRAVNANLASFPRDFAFWDGIETMRGKQWDAWIMAGEAILRYQQQTVDSQCANAVEIEMDGHKVLCVNATTLISEIAGQLAADRPFGVTWFQRGDGKKIWSLRSRDGGVDVSEIAKRRGGGGHRNAAGFEE